MYTSNCSVKVAGNGGLRTGIAEFDAYRIDTRFAPELEQISAWRRLSVLRSCFAELGIDPPLKPVIMA